MKKLLSISLIVMISFIAFSFTTPEIAIDKSVEKKSTELIAEEEALYCSVTIGTRSGTCWFCDCKELADTLIANQ